jgi:transcriptional regulator with XRE-family HTH domain
MTAIVINLASMARKSKTLDNAPNRIREWRQLRGLTLEELALRVGVTTGHMQKWEIADRNISYEWFKRIARALNVNVADLLTAEDNPDSLSDAERKVVAAMREDDAFAHNAKVLAEARQTFKQGPEILPFPKRA